MNTAAIARPEIRFAGSLPIAFCVTIALLYLMHSLIYTDQVAIENSPSIKIPMVIAEPKEIETRLPKKPEPIPDPEPLPQVPRMELAVADPGETAIPVGTGYTPTTGSELTVNLGGGALVKQVMVPPQYPQRALARGIEGYVDLAFEVTAYGVTHNIRVLRAEPAGVFDKAAIRAVKRWKYRPLEVDGVAVASPNVQERIRFTIDR